MKCDAKIDFNLLDPICKNWEIDISGNFAVEPKNSVIYCLRLIEVTAKMLFNHRRLCLLSVELQHSWKFLKLHKLCVWNKNIYIECFISHVKGHGRESVKALHKTY